MKDMSFLLAGVGGQGTLLASNVLAQVGVRAGFDVKKAEVHGMAQRGGSVSSHMRWGKKIYSPGVGAQGGDAAIVAGLVDGIIVGRQIYLSPDPRSAAAEYGPFRQ